MRNKITRIISYMLLSFVIMQMLSPLCVFAESDIDIIKNILSSAVAYGNACTTYDMNAMNNYIGIDKQYASYIDNSGNFIVNGNTYKLYINGNGATNYYDEIPIYHNYNSQLVNYDDVNKNCLSFCFGSSLGDVSFSSVNSNKLTIKDSSGNIVVSASVKEDNISGITTENNEDTAPSSEDNVTIVDLTLGDSGTYTKTGSGYWKFRVNNNGTYKIEPLYYIYAVGMSDTQPIPNGYAEAGDHGDQYGDAQYFPFYAATTYYIKDGNATSITFTYANESMDEATATGSQTQAKGESLLDKLEHLIADMITGCSNTIVMLVSAMLHRPITIDDVIFNHYDMTSINFFEGEFQEGSIIALLKDAINNWYNLFRNIAIVGYFIILVYMAIKILLGTTAQKKADYKALFINWIVGLAILFLFPYVIKYEIKINEGFVTAIEASKLNIFENQTFPEASTGSVGEINYDTDFSKIDSSGTDYMSIMRNKAQSSRRIFNAIVYLIMVYQLIFIIILYYKRVFMIAFLLVLFPLVALSYVLDKIGDGKSQAFNTWSKEMMLNIFVQSFHAIVYMFALGATYSAGNISNPDVIFMLVGITFLFKGEEIIKKIFGQSSPAGTVGSLAETAAKTVAAVTITKNVAKNLKDNVVGAKSHLGNFINAKRDYKMYSAMERNFDNASTTRSPYIGMVNIPENPDEAEKELAGAIGVWRNRDYRNAEQLANAMSIMQKYAGKGANFDTMLKDANLSNSQFSAMRGLGNKVSSMARNGESSTVISQTIRAEIDYIFPVEEDKNLLYAVVVTGMSHGIHSDRVTNINLVRSELNREYERHREIKNDISETNEGSISDSERYSRDEKVSIRTEQIVNETIGGMEIDSSVRTRLEKVARCVAVIENLHLYSKRELFEETKIAGSVPDAFVKKMIAKQTGKDVDTYNHILADEVCKQTYGDDYREESLESRVVRDATYIDICESACNVVDYYENSLNRVYIEKEDEFTLHEIIRKQNATDEEKNNMIGRVGHQRRLQNMDEILATRDIGREIIQQEEIDITRVNREEGPATIDGYTKEDIHDLKIAALDEMDEQRLRTISTVGLSTATGVIGGIIGAVIHDDNSSGIEGAGMGTIVGAGVGDKIAEKAAGNEKNTKNITMINPETGDIITVNNAQLGGAFSTSGRIAASGIPIRGLKGLWIRYDPNVSRTIIQDRVRRRIQEDETRNS